jgi:biotin carboxyl carrier protein
MRAFLITALIVVAVAGTAFFTRQSWLPYFVGAPTATKAADDHHDHAHGDAQRVTLSPQAQANLRLSVEAIAPETYWRSIQIPGMVVDRPGLSDRAVTTSATGIITEIRARPGDTVRAGQPLFTLRLQSETIQNAQAELFKNTRDLQSNAEQRALLVRAGGAVPEQRLMELDNQERRLKAAAASYRQELLSRGLKPDQVTAAAEGRFAVEITIAAPGATIDGQPLISDAPRVDTPEVAFEMEEMKAQLGDHVQAGQTLATLANHQLLLIEGRAFKQESSLLERAAQNGWPVQAEFAEEASDWPETTKELKVQHLANSVDPISRTFAFYLPLTNQSRAYTHDGRTHLVWRFRPGQRVRLQVPVEKFEDVFPLPVSGIVRDGAETYVFRQNGDVFDRKPVHVVFQDRQTAVIANDGSIGPGQFITRNGAATLNRVLKAQALGEEAGHGHDHHGHSH